MYVVMLKTLKVDRETVVEAGTLFDTDKAALPGYIQAEVKADEKRSPQARVTRTVETVQEAMNWMPRPVELKMVRPETILAPPPHP